MWSKPMWHHFPIWCFVKITGAFPSHGVNSNRSLLNFLDAHSVPIREQGIGHVLACDQWNGLPGGSWFDLDPNESLPERIRFLTTLVAAR